MNILTTATVDEILSGKVTSPLPIETIPNHMGINLCAVRDLSWVRQPDGQLVSLTVNFKPAE